MKKLLMLLCSMLCMVLPSLSPADMQEVHPRDLAAAWQDVRKRASPEQKTIPVRDRAAALELLQKLGVVRVPEDGVKLSSDGLTIIVKPGERESGVFYILQSQDAAGTACEIRIVPEK